MEINHSELSSIFELVKPANEIRSFKDVTAKSSSLLERSGEVSANVNKEALAEKDPVKLNLQLQQLVDALSSMEPLIRKGIGFSLDKESEKMLVIVKNIDTGELIRQIPTDEALELAQNLLENNISLMAATV